MNGQTKGPAAWWRWHNVMLGRSYALVELQVCLCVYSAAARMHVPIFSTEGIELLNKSIPKGVTTALYWWPERILPVAVIYANTIAVPCINHLIVMLTVITNGLLLSFFLHFSISLSLGQKKRNHLSVTGWRCIKKRHKTGIENRNVCCST